MDRVPDFESVGSEFESRRGRQIPGSGTSETPTSGGKDPLEVAGLSIRVRLCTVNLHPVLRLPALRGLLRPALLAILPVLA
jgi:hypothetical protein